MGFYANRTELRARRVTVLGLFRSKGRNSVAVKSMRPDSVGQE